MNKDNCASFVIQDKWLYPVNLVSSPKSALKNKHQNTLDMVLGNLFETFPETTVLFRKPFVFLK